MRINKGMKRLAFGLATAVAAMAVPSAAMAQRVYNVASDFGESRFSYGTGNGATGAFNAVSTSQSPCFGSAAFTCYASVDANNVPIVLKNTTTSAVNFQTVTVPGLAVLMHPGNGVGSTDSIIRFTSTFSSLYSVSGLFSRLDNVDGPANGNNGVIASVFLNNALGTTLLSSGIIAATAGANTAFNLASVQLNSGDSLSFVVNNNGIYNYDSTGISAVITAVPEASTWAMMLVGFGMAGGALRRRRKAAGQAAFA